MRPNGIHGHGYEKVGSNDAIRTGFVARATAQIRERPVLAASAAAAFGAVLGGVVLSGWGRLAFVATVGYFASEFWRRDGHANIDSLLASLSNERRERSTR